MKNAIILAAGKSNRFAPFTYERPKGLFRVKGEILIERQIKQLLEAGIREIIVVVGYMKEKFFYLENKFPEVRLLVNNNFGVKGNLYSLYVAKDYIKKTYVCCADHYFVNNPFIGDPDDDVSYRACTYKEGKFREFTVEYSDADVITGVDLGGSYKMAMVGQAYFNERFSAAFVKMMEDEIDSFRVPSLFWEEFFERHIKELTLYMRQYNNGDMLEFDSIEDLRQFDSDFLINVDSEIITNICNTLHCHPNTIKDIKVINAGLTNVSFSFYQNNIQYVYRHPGGSAGNLINREAEIFAQTKAKEMKVDKSVILMKPEGWKLSYCVQNIVECNFEKYPWQFERGMEYLRKIHSITENPGIKIFDNIQEGKKLMAIASAYKGNLFAEFSEDITKVEKLDQYLKEDAKRLGMKLCLCHNDVYEPNYIATSDWDLYLIDWEYAGFNDAANDINCITARYDLTEEQIAVYYKVYFGRELTPDESRHYWAFIPITAFYWFCWGLYKGSVGDDDGFFFLPSYRNFRRFIDKSLSLFEDKKSKK